MNTALTVWCVTDEKPGHDAQLRGLACALERQTGSAALWLPATHAGSYTLAAGTARPDLILAAGHATHLPALRLRWRYGGKLVVLMKPSLPRRLFDLCVIPEHDEVIEGRRVITTRGPLNDIPASTESQKDAGLILLGGNSRHFRWEDEPMLKRLETVIGANPEVHWTITSSRRTPESFCSLVAELANPRLDFVPWQDTDQTWLRTQFRRCGVIWVSEDSASMLYEALSTGARVGLLPVHRMRDSRVSRGVDRLLQEGRLATLDQLEAGGDMGSGSEPLREAERVATYILRWLGGS